MTEINVFIPGVPLAKPRPKISTKGGKPRMYDPGTADDWKSRMAYALTEYVPLTPHDGPAIVSAEFYFARPQRLLKKSSDPNLIPHTKKPDRDNLDKALLDTLKDIGILKDDAVVYRGELIKWYVSLSEPFNRVGMALRIKLIGGASCK